MDTLAAAEVGPGVVAMLETCAESLDLGSGETRLEAVFNDGVLRYVYRHGRLDRDELERRELKP
jgi:hypothetical protein